MSTRVQASDIKQTFNGDKTGNPFFDYVFRPLSFYCTAPLANAGISANQASFIGAVIGVIGLMFWSLGSWTGWIVGTIFMLIHLLFDLIDGNLARYYDKASYIGKFTDAFFDKLIGICTPLAIAIGLINFNYYPMSSVLGLTPWELMLLVGFATTLWSLESEFRSRYELFLKSIDKDKCLNNNASDGLNVPDKSKLSEEHSSFIIKATSWLLRRLKLLRKMLLHGFVFFMIPFGMSEWFLIIFTIVSIVTSTLVIISMFYKGFSELNVHRRSASHRTQ